MATGRVFIVQEPLHRVAGDIVPRIDYATLTPYGELVFLFRWGVLKDGDLSDTRPFLAKLREKLKDFSDADHLVCLGNPALCAMAVAVALEQNDGYVCLLDWMRNESRYRQIELEMNDGAAKVARA